MRLTEKYNYAYQEAMEKEHRPVIYLSGPYCADTKEKVLANIARIEDVAKQLVEKNIGYFSPHSNSALLTIGTFYFDHLKSEGDVHGYWMNLDRRILLSCDAMLVVGDFSNSKGTKEEIAYATRLGIPVFYTLEELLENNKQYFSYPKQFQVFREIQTILYQQHREKNLDYSPYNVGATGNIGLVTRIWDKVARLMKLAGFDIATGTYSESKKANNEPVEDTFGDLANYSIIALIYRGKLWGK